MNEKNAEVNILGIPFKKMDKPAAYGLISEALTDGNAFKIFTPNAEILYRAYASPELSALLRSADLLLPDGVGVVAASRIQRTPLPCRITGIDTAEFILWEAARRGLSVYLLGGRKGVAERAAKALRRRYPQLKIAGTRHGYFSSEEEKNEALSDILVKAPHILFVCLGFPAQEKFICEYADRLPSLRLCVGLGGSLDVWSEDIRRAPRWIRNSGFEWLYRVLSQPRRLRRLPYLMKFSLALLPSLSKIWILQFCPRRKLP